MSWGRLIRELRELIDAHASEEAGPGIQKVVRINRAIAVNDEPGAAASASAVQDSSATQTEHE
jgi:hypothetical protein